MPVLIAAMLLFMTAAQTSAQVTLNMGDILVIEPGTAGVSKVDPVTGSKTVISQHDLLDPPHRAIGVAFGADGDIIVVHRQRGLIRINPRIPQGGAGQQSIISEGGYFKDPWAVAVNKNTGDIYVADSGYSNDGGVNEPGKIIRINYNTGQQELIAVGSSPCTPPASAPSHACLNTTSAGSYVAHPYGIAIDYTTSPATLVVADMSAFNGAGAIIRVQMAIGGTQTLLWGPASAVPAPQVAQATPLGCPMGIAVEPNGNLLATGFTFPLPANPVIPPPAATYYGCSVPGIFRIDLANNVQKVVNANAPAWQAIHAYAVGDVIREELSAGGGAVHRVVTAGISQAGNPGWTSTVNGTTNDGSVVWQNLGRGANWRIPFGMSVEPVPAVNPTNYNIIVAEEGYSMLFRLDTTGGFLSPTPLTENIVDVTHAHVITTPTDPPPLRSNGQPGGVLPSITTQTTLSLTTSLAATCRYSAVPGVAYSAMTNVFTTTGSTTHSRIVSGLTPGSNYAFYVRCVNATNNANLNDFVISFSVAAMFTTNSTFVGSETPLSEGGMWDSPGSWGDLRKNGSAFTVDVNGAARLTTPNVGPDHYAEITYDRDPGAFAWAGVMTRVQGANNGSGYLAIAYNGQVQLYRANDNGGLSFELLTSVTASLGIAPRRLRLVSLGDHHRVYLNGAQVIDYIDPANVYFDGQPGFAASQFGGAQVNILTYESGPANAMDALVPIRFNGQPVGALTGGTTQTTLGLSTSENATCRYSPTPGVPYLSMTLAFTTTGSTTHATTLTGLTSGSHNYYVRCADVAGNSNPDDFVISFSVALSSSVVSNFVGHESVLIENGIWDSPGTWTDMRKTDGAFTSSLNSMARLVTPIMAADQYSEITYAQNPGTASWIGVATRIQDAGNGSGYLAIAYASSVRLYRVDDAGGLSFTQLATATASIGTAPRRLRLESIGNTHRVLFNGVQVITHTASGPVYTNGQPGLAASVFGGPQVKILSFEGGNVTGSGDTTPPARQNGSPKGVLASSTTQVTLTLTTNEIATCRYSLSAGVTYASMTNTFAGAGSTLHSATVTGLTSGQSYAYHVRCLDTSGNANSDDFAIAFSIANASAATSNFVGTELTLSEDGVWESPGSWADLQNDNGAYATGVNAQGRLSTPLLAADQYSEITYSQDPGAASWVGVTTRVTSAQNGSGYLAIAYAGQVQLYRADDNGALNFVLLASSTLDISVAPRRLRLESQGDNHRVYFNGAQVLNHTATGTLYSSGQPGIAASVFPGPQVKILSFEAGNLIVSDTTPPFRDVGQPIGTLPASTATADLSLTTNENATCRFSTTPGIAWGSMTSNFSPTVGMNHLAAGIAVTPGTSYTYYVRCRDTVGNENPDDYIIAFAVASPTAVLSTFTGIENPLSEGGMWDSPGAWADMQKNAGAFASALNAGARLTTPNMNADQYAEITYVPNPGSSSWVGVLTRIQGATNGGGYLVIAYNGEVRLYRADDAGSLSFTQLAAATVNLSTAPRRVRLESQGNIHRVYYNGTQVLSFTDTSAVYTTGQPGIAASVFGGPTVKVLTFEAGNLGQ